MYITLATRRDQVDFINEKKLAELPGEEYVSVGKIEGDFPESSLPTQLNLSIKEQAQVIFIDNDYERRWVNGTIGMVSGIDENGNVYVLLESGVEHLVEPTSWRNYKYKYNEKEKRIEEEIVGTFEQLPIRLAWAITVHKSQGLTFSRVVVDFDRRGICRGTNLCGVESLYFIGRIGAKKQDLFPGYLYPERDRRIQPNIQ